MLKVRCPSCGKSAAVPETDAGLPAVCLACGARYTVPELAAPAEVSAADVETFFPVSGAGRPGGRRGWLVGAAAALVLATATVAVLLVARARPDPIDARTAARYKTQAETAAASGRLADAYQKYHELETIVGGRSIRDPETRVIVQRARSDKDRVYAMLLDQMAAQPRPPQPAVAGESAKTQASPGERGEPENAEAGSEAAEPAGPEAVAVVPPARAVPESPTDEAPASPGTPTTTPGQPAPRPVQPPVLLAGQRPPIRPMPEPSYGVSDEQIGKAIDRGVEYLLSQFDDRTHALVDVTMDNAQGGGRNALAVYALLQCGQTLKDERLNPRGPQMDRKINAMKRADLMVGHPQVYALGLRATALALFNRSQDRKTLRADVEALLRCHTNGAYWYPANPRAINRSAAANGAWDNSNSQYGLLGVWSGAEAGVEVPSSYWALVEGHWESTQLANGQWSYAGERRPTLTMTMAGIASLFVTHDWLDAPRSGHRVGREPFSRPLQKALNWLEAGDNAVAVEDVRSWWGYAVYGIERVGLASGFKYFGRHDWYRQIAAHVVAEQSHDGSWRSDAIETSFALLFLARGRHPILMNKLRFDGYWANRPRDAANLARFAARQLERELNWQVVPLRTPGPGPGDHVNRRAIGAAPRQHAPGEAERWSDWMDSPILYLASHRAPRLFDSDYDNLRSFIEAGGLLFTHADGDEAAFNEWVRRDLAPKLFPKYELRDLPNDHALYNLVYKIEDPTQRPKLRGVSNGARMLMVHSPVDIARAWQVRDQKTKRPLFQLGVNLFLYGAGKRDLRNRLESPYVSDPGEPLNGMIGVARLEYAGNWDPEPGAWRRFGRWFQRQTGTGVTVRHVAASSQALDPRAAPVAHLTGTARHDFSDADAAAVKRYVESGGVLLVDNCGGAGTFDAGVQETLLAKAFPGAKLRPMPIADHPLFHARGAGTGTDDLTKPRLRPDVGDRVGDASTTFLGLAAGRGRVVFTALDLTAGLLGTRTWGVAGYEPDYAQAFMKNLLFWAADGRPGPAATPATRPATGNASAPAPPPPPPAPGSALELAPGLAPRTTPAATDRDARTASGQTSP